MSMLDYFTLGAVVGALLIIVLGGAILGVQWMIDKVRTRRAIYRELRQTVWRLERSENDRLTDVHRLGSKIQEIERRSGAAARGHR